MGMIFRRTEEDNKKLLEQYPFLCAVDWGGHPLRDNYNITILDDIPGGWELLMLQLAEEIDRIGYDPDFYFMQAKEKYGQLRLYTANSSREIEDLIDAYAHISENVCCKCGKPDVPMLTKIGWISPFCEDCFNRIDYYRNADIKYEDVADEKEYWTIPDSYKVTMFRPHGSSETVEIDISEYANRYRELWRELYAGK